MTATPKQVGKVCLGVALQQEKDNYDIEAL
jgi:hypothetical protein